MLVDTHTHLFTKEFDDDRAEVIERAKEQGVGKFLLPNIDLDSLDSLYQTALDFPECEVMLGLHPCSVSESWEHDLFKIRDEIAKHNPVAIGEIGIDLYWDKTFVFEQKMAFEQQIIWAKELSLPIAIHVRDAFDEVFEVLDRQNDEQLSGVFHCFTGNVEQALKALSYDGFMLGIGGVVTFKNAGLDKTLKEAVPLDRLVLETDSPYLAPTPYRGKRNESAYTSRVCEKVSDIYEVSEEEVARITTANAKLLFPKAF